jgi:hypothetical protein
MTLKNIGVLVDATPEGEKRIDYAAALAHQCGAHLRAADDIPGPLDAAEGQSLRLMASQDVKLMTKNQDLSLQGDARPDQ